MTPVAERRLMRYIATIGKMLGLCDWKVILRPDEPDSKDHAASISCVYGRRVANLWLSHGFEHLEPAEQRQILVHELLHVHFDSMTTLIEQALPPALGAPAYGVFDAAYRERAEHAVDAIAEAVAPVFPLPE